jgi:hypothetical protein
MTRSREGKRSQPDPPRREPVKRSVGIYGMSEYCSSRATTQLQLVLGFGNLSECAIEAGIARPATYSGQPAGS